TKVNNFNPESGFYDPAETLREPRGREASVPTTTSASRARWTLKGYPALQEAMVCSQSATKEGQDNNLSLLANVAYKIYACKQLLCLLSVESWMLCQGKFCLIFG
uniref:Uncharacterized protein n=1 Tax=Xiphophorus maculatus TaxID=8083 RepID=A0A3B5PPY7_XIPMA